MSVAADAKVAALPEYLIVRPLESPLRSEGGVWLVGGRQEMIAGTILTIGAVAFERLGELTPGTDVMVRSLTGRSFRVNAEPRYWLYVVHWSDVFLELVFDRCRACGKRAASTFEGVRGHWCGTHANEIAEGMKAARQPQPHDRM